MPNQSLYSDIIALPKNSLTLCTGGTAVWSVESLMSDRFCLENDLNRTYVQEPGQSSKNAFGRNFEVLGFEGPQGAMAAASGLEMTGRRTAVLIKGDRLGEIHDQLSVIVNRHIPLVVYAVCGSITRECPAFGSGHNGYHVISNAGGFQAFARNVQEAVDLSLVARRVSERSLLPGVIGMDASETAFAVQSFVAPDSDLISRYVKSPAMEIQTPTKAQEHLFGNRRPSIPQWFHWDKPVAQGLRMEGQDYAAARAGQIVFFRDHLAEIAQEEMDALSSETGRPLSFISKYQLSDATHILVAQGAAIETAEMVAQHLRTTQGIKVGVLGIIWLRPFGAQQIKEVLGNVKSATILEKDDHQLAGAPSLRVEIEPILSSLDINVFSATYGVGGQPYNASQFLAACENMISGKNSREQVFLGISSPNIETGFPKKQVRLEQVKNDYPVLEQNTLPIKDVEDIRPQGAKSAALFAPSIDVPEGVLASISEELVNSTGNYVRSSSLIGEGGFWIGRATAASEPFGDPGNEFPVETVFVGGLDLPTSINPVALLKEKGSVIIASALDKEILLPRIPEAWRKAMIAGNHNLYLFKGSGKKLLESAPTLLEEPGKQLDSLSLKDSISSNTSEIEPPGFLKQVTGTSSTYDSITRFWGEVLQPRLEGEFPQTVPDPNFSLGTVPSSTSAFVDKSDSLEQIPEFDPENCSGSGNSWIYSSDAGFGVSAISTENLLNGVLDQVKSSLGPDNNVADKLKRAHKNLGPRINRLLVDKPAGILSEDLLWKAFDWMMEKLKASEQEIPFYKEAFGAMCQKMLSLSISVTNILFYQPEKSKKGSGLLLIMALDPKSVKGGGIPGDICPETYKMVTPTPEKLKKLHENRRIWEQLPDTSAETINKLKDQPEIGLLPAVFLSRHSAQSIAGGDNAEPGSGTRLALKFFTGMAEYHVQRNTGSYSQKLFELNTEVKEKIKELFAQSLPVDDLSAVEEVLDKMPAHRANLKDVITGLDEKGKKAGLDGQKIKQFAELSQEIDSAYDSLTKGINGFGRARYGLLLASKSAQNLARFPNNPFQVPVIADLPANGAEMALGIVEGMTQDYVDEMKWVRFIEAALQSGPNEAQQDEALQNLCWEVLTPEEKAACPPILLIVGDEVLTDRGLGGLSRLLASGRPIKIILLDGKEKLVGRIDPANFALAHGRSFVLSTSLAHPGHLGEGMEKALIFPGPAFIHIHAPCPAKHGFSPETTIRRSRIAVETRLHPLICYDPGKEGVFGLRIDLNGNPDSAEGGLTVAHWAAGESRFSGFFKEVEANADTSSHVSLDSWLASDEESRKDKIPVITLESDRKVIVNDILARATLERNRNYEMLLELAGIESPFIDRVKSQIEDKIKKEYDVKMAEMKSAHEKELQELQLRQKEEAAAVLTGRLLELTRFAPKNNEVTAETGVN